MLLAVDPGTTHSAFVCLDGMRLVDFAKVPNGELVERLPIEQAKHCVVEMIACYGMPVGAEVYETCVFIGRLLENLDRMRLPNSRMTRVKVKQALCHRTAGVNDSVIRQRLIDLYGGKEVAIGGKKTPGPLYGVKADVWAALALGTAYVITSRISQ